MDQLTDKQKAVFEFIEKYQMSYGRSPTLREMREHFQVSSDNGVLKHLKALESKGYLKKDNRGIALIDSVKEKLECSVVSLPVLGMIPAGGPVISDEYVDRWINLESDLVKDKADSFILRVTGESMIDAGIFEGDLVVASAKREPRNGDIVIALVDGANTLKRLVKEGGKAYLRAENPAYTDIVPVEELTVQGVVTTLLRTY
ncbi:repressor LexA [Candidatus Peregrinibacteria bacterium]|jgi:repressor LexA|nr:repressor LexA [Candidatus Peregrinibacteria bacterium]MBT4056030.1 repressor LexA [Candidatus Peregrinibacteria bacterium]